MQHASLHKGLHSMTLPFPRWESWLPILSRASVVRTVLFAQVKDGPLHRKELNWDNMMIAMMMKI